MTGRIPVVIGVNILVLFGLLRPLEATGQLVALVRPSYDVLFSRIKRWMEAGT